MTEIAEIARGLTKAQREAVCANTWRCSWSTITALNRRRLLAIRTCFPDGQGLLLTPLGLAVRAHLTQEPNE